MNGTDRRVLTAVCELADRQMTVRSIAAHLGLASVSEVHASLHRLRDREMVCFEDGRTGTIRPARNVVLLSGVPWLARPVNP